MAAIAILGATGYQCSDSGKRANPFLEAYDTPYEIPPFDKITNDDYMPALREGIRLHNEEIKAIAENPDTPAKCSARSFTCSAHSPNRTLPTNSRPYPKNSCPSSHSTKTK